ncbi:MAG: hypothetical protein ABWY93_06010 [Mycobacterium sp.]
MPDEVNGASGAGDVLAVFGALDHASIGRAIDQFLPRASANVGWYGELSRYLFGASAPSTIDLGEAFARVADADQRGVRLTQPQKARLLFGISTAAQLDRLVPDSAVPSLSDPGLIRLMKDALAAAGPGSLDRSTRQGIVDRSLQSFLELLQTTFNSKNDFKTVRSTLHTSESTQGVIGKETSRIPLCSTSIATVNGIECVIVDTIASSDDVSLNQLLKIVNPYNWRKNYPEFFLSMDPDQEVVRPDGWRRVLETVQLLEGFDVRTPLKYLPLKDSPTPGQARLEYDLDESRMGAGDGKVRVDRGYINMIAQNATGDPGDPGVRVRTRKVVHIEGIRPFAQERLVCIAGYGTANADFLFGRALQPQDPADNLFDFDYALNEEQADQTRPEQAAPLVMHAVPAAVKLWTDTLADVTNDYVGLAEKWWDGALNMAEITDFSKRVSGKLVSAPLEFLQTTNRPRNPGN